MSKSRCFVHDSNAAKSQHRTCCPSVCLRSDVVQNPSLAWQACCPAPQRWSDYLACHSHRPFDLTISNAHLSGTMFEVLISSSVDTQGLSTFLRQPRAVSFGSSGCVFELSKSIVVKIYFDPDEEQAQFEHRFLQDIARDKPWSDDVVRCFYSLPDLAFLENVPGTTLELRIYWNQAPGFRGRPGARPVVVE